MIDSLEYDGLLRRYQEGDAEAARLLVIRSAPVLFRSVRPFVASHDAAEEVLQDAWVRIHSSRHTWRPGEPALPWLLAVVRYTRLDYLRRHYRRKESGFHALEREPAAAPPAEPSSELDTLLRALPDRQREVVIMLKFDGLSLDEVARTTGTTVGSVKQRASRAYARLRSLLEKGAPLNAAS